MTKKLMLQVFEATILVAFVLFMGAVDYATGYYLSFFVFYFIPIALVASRHGVNAAYAISVLCAVTWFTSDHFSGHPYPRAWMGIWNMSIRLVAFLVVSYTIARIRRLLASAQKEVKTLQGFLPICAKCKKIRDDKGYWHQVESYISTHADVRFSHGLCELCTAETLRELEDDIIAEHSAAPIRQPDARLGDGER